MEILPERFGVRLHTYVLMPNHYHVQIETPRLNLSEAIRWLNISYAAWFNRKTRRNGPLFQGRFKAVVHDPNEAHKKLVPTLTDDDMHNVTAYLATVK